MTATIHRLPIDEDMAIFICATRAARENRAPWDIASEEYAKARVLNDTDTAEAFKAAGIHYTERTTP